MPRIYRCHCKLCGAERPKTEKMVCAACAASGPLCACGCGKTLVFNRKGDGSYGWGTVLFGHLTQLRWNTLGKAAYRREKTGVTMETRTCEHCRTKFEIQPFLSRRFCTQQCYGKSRAGKRPSWWKQGMRTGERTRHKYIARKDVKGWAHTMIMEKILGRPLSSTEVVHHIDGNGLNNDPANLWLFHCSNCHSHHHTTGNPLVYQYDFEHTPRVYVRGRDRVRHSFECAWCGKRETTFIKGRKYCSMACSGKGVAIDKRQAANRG